MTRKALLIINPISGTWSKEGLHEMVTRRLGEAGWTIDCHSTTGPGDATAVAAESAGRYDAVLAAGGDGTVNETAAALCGTKAALGIIPCGSGNGLARHLGIPIDAEMAVDVILRDHITTADYGTVNDSKFFCTFGLGFDAAVSDLFAKQKRRGRMSYVRSIIEEFVKYHPERYTIIANGHEITREAFLVAVCNASQYGNNAYIAPEASVTDGLLDIIIIHSGNPLQTARVGLDMMTGFINSNTLIQSVRVSSAIISRPSAGPAHLDGEPVDMPELMSINCHRHGLRVFTPASIENFRPLISPVQAAFNDARLTIRHLVKK